MSYYNLISMMPKTPAFVGLLDTYSGASAAYSLRRLSSTYTGNLIRVRRSSDNAEQNIGFVNNVLDTASLLSFCGAGNGFVTTWYDQSGNNNNLTQTGAVYQPRIVNGGAIETDGSKPSIRFAPSNSTPLFGGDILKVGSNSLCVYFVAKSNNTGYGQNIYVKSLTGPASSRYGFYNATDNKANSFVISSSNTDESIASTVASNARNLYSSEYIANTNFKLYRNGVNEATRTPVTTIGTSSFEFQIGAGNSGTGGQGYGYELNGNIQEMIFYLSNQSSNRTGIESNINTFYTIY